MIAIKWSASVLLYLLMLPISTPAALIVSLFTRAMPELPYYSWGGLFGTYDNPPQGDRKWLREHPELTGWKGYRNRVGWMRRNRLYGLKRKLSIDFSGGMKVSIKGNPNISDKYKVPGWLFALALDGRKVKAFEWYSVTPYSKTRCLRVRLGWKIKGDKFDEVGEFAPLVFTINPLDSYGDE